MSFHARAQGSSRAEHRQIHQMGFKTRSLSDGLNRLLCFESVTPCETVVRARSRITFSHSRGYHHQAQTVEYSPSLLGVTLGLSSSGLVRGLIVMQRSFTAGAPERRSCEQDFEARLSAHHSLPADAAGRPTERTQAAPKLRVDS